MGYTWIYMGDDEALILRKLFHETWTDEMRDGPESHLRSNDLIYALTRVYAPDPHGEDYISSNTSRAKVQRENWRP